MRKPRRRRKKMSGEEREVVDDESREAKLRHPSFGGVGDGERKPA